MEEILTVGIEDYLTICKKTDFILKSAAVVCVCWCEVVLSGPARQTEEPLAKWLFLQSETAVRRFQSDEE